MQCSAAMQPAVDLCMETMSPWLVPGCGTHMARAEGSDTVACCGGSVEVKGP